MFGEKNLSLRIFFTIKEYILDDFFLILIVNIT